MKFRIIAIAGMAAMASACATTTSAPTYPATLSFNRTDCPDVPQTGSAISLTPEKAKKVWSIQRTLSASAPCLSRQGKSAPYLVFALPAYGSTSMVELGAGLELTRVLSPMVVLLDGQGAETRSFTRDQYMFRPGILSVQFVPRENERYALVTVDPEPIGQKYDSIVAGTTTTTIYTGFGASNWTAGHESSWSRGFSYEGEVRALVYPVEKAK